MKKLICVLTLVILILGLSSCGNDGAPEGMQLVSGGEELGYYFYAPEEWTVSNLGEVKAAFVSNLDTTSVSFTELDKNDFEKPSADLSDESYFFESFFNDTKSEFPADTEYLLNGEPCTFGSGEEKADRAAKYTYSYTYDGHKFGFMQILVSHDGNYYVFTYCAMLEEKTDGKTRYDYYLEKLGSIIESFRFVGRSGGTSEAPEYERDGDGYILVSEKKLSGFELYVPDTYEVDYSSAIVSATREDGTNITLTEATKTGLTADSYWTLRKEELSAIVGEITVIQENVSTKLGNNSQWAFAYEYTYEYGGETYHVYQINAVDGPMLFAKGYCFTFTAKEENYEKHGEELQKIIEKVKF